MSNPIVPEQEQASRAHVEELRAARTQRNWGRGVIAAGVLMMLPLVPVEMASVGWTYGSRFTFDIRYDWSLIVFFVGLVELFVGVALADRARKRTEKATDSLATRRS